MTLKLSNKQTTYDVAKESDHHRLEGSITIKETTLQAWSGYIYDNHTDNNHKQIGWFNWSENEQGENISISTTFNEVDSLLIHELIKQSVEELKDELTEENEEGSEAKEEITNNKTNEENE